MITRLEEIPVTKESYPFASAERYLKLSERGYVEKEYYMYGTANVYETATSAARPCAHCGCAVYKPHHCPRTAGHCKMQQKRCSGDYQPNEFYGD